MIRRWKKAIMASCLAAATVGVGLGVNHLASAGTDARVEHLQQLEAQLQQEQAKHQAMKDAPPHESEEQGLKVKQLMVDIGKVSAELNAGNVDEQAELDRRIQSARSVWLTDLAAFKNDTRPEGQRIYGMLQKRLAKLNEIERDSKAGTKSAKELLAEFDSIHTLQ